MTLYQEELLDHYHYPRNKGSVINPDFYNKTHNFSCGDSIIIAGCIKNNVIIDIKFEGSGCVISQASASMLIELVVNKTIEFSMNLGETDILHLIKIPNIGPTRLRCALLSLNAIHEALTVYLELYSKYRN